MVQECDPRRGFSCKNFAVVSPGNDDDMPWYGTSAEKATCEYLYCTVSGNLQISGANEVTVTIAVNAGDWIIAAAVVVKVATTATVIGFWN